VSPVSDAAAFERELSPLLSQALGLATAMLMNAVEAEDAVQEAALRAWHRRANRRPDTELRPWFLAIVANQCREQRRGRWARVLRFADPPDRPAPGSDRDGVLDMRRALGRLPRRIRLAVVLRYYLDLPIEDIARVLDCSVEAAKSRVRRGVQALEASMTSPEDPT
jgi:RNA polymerase sigma-70 factor (ECF subfamily)